MRCAVLVGLVAFWLIAIGMHAQGQRSRPPAAAAHAGARAKPVAPARKNSQPSKAPAAKAEAIQSWIVSSRIKVSREDALEDALQAGHAKLVAEVNDLTHNARGEPTVDIHYLRGHLWKDLRKSDVQLPFGKAKAGPLAELDAHVLGKENGKAEENPKVDEVFLDGHWVVDVSWDLQKLDNRDLPDGADKLDMQEAHQVYVRVGLTPQDRADLLQQIRNERMGDRMLGLGKVLGVLVVLLGGVAGYLRLDEWTKGYYTTWLRLGVIGLIGIAGMGYWLLP